MRLIIVFANHNMDAIVIMESMSRVQIPAEAVFVLFILITLGGVTATLF